MIALDVGNSRIKFGHFPDRPISQPGELPECDDFLAVSLRDAVIPWPQLELLFERELPAHVNRAAPVTLVGEFVGTSVNRAGWERLLSEWPVERWPLPRLLANQELPISNGTIYPERVGTDRLIKAVAANLIRKPGDPIIVVDSGTATTVDWITEQGEFAGGAILPGIELSSKALHQHTHQLPLIDVQSIAPSVPAVGRDTVAALTSGLIWGQVGAIRELIHQMTGERASPPAEIVITGGAGQLLAAYFKGARYHPTLTLTGIAVTYQTTLKRSNST